MGQEKILILGAKGMLGSDLCFVFKKDRPVCWDHEDLDITNQQEVEEKIKKLKPGIVINAAAYTNVEMAEKEFNFAKKINVEAVKYLVKVCTEIGAIFVHFSTDYVFDGKNKNGYQEKDIAKKPINKYGLSKLLGEQKLLCGSTQIATRINADNISANQRNYQRKPAFYLIRTSWLFGSKTEPTKHKNFVQTILKLAKEKKASPADSAFVAETTSAKEAALAKEGLKISNDQFGKPTYTFDLAQATKKLLGSKKPFGIYHLPNEGATTWYKFAREIVKISKSKITIKPCKTSEYRTLAKRPKYSILVNNKLPKLRNWKLALKDYLTLK